MAREFNWFANADGIADKLQVQTFDIEGLSVRYKKNRDNGGLVAAATRKKVLAILSGYFTYLHEKTATWCAATRAGGRSGGRRGPRARAQLVDGRRK